MTWDKAFLVIWVLLVFFMSQSHGSSSSSSSSSSIDESEFNISSSIDDSQKVEVGLYYEALCPYCANFIVNGLAKIFENGLISIINLKLVPWGNAYYKDNNVNTWICQHGPDECLLNTVEACAIKVWPELGAHFSFRFIECVERLHLEDKHSEWQSCFATKGLNPKPVVNCFNSGLGFQVERSLANETARLNPPHRFVPWVTVDNLALEDDYQNFVSYICRAYKGPGMPKACSAPQVEISSSSNSNSGVQVCYKSELKN